jgi:hypothetical protein
MKKPNFKGADTEQAIISEMIRWLHERDCAVVVWTKEELRGVDLFDLESGMIEWGSESIEMNVEEED